MKEKRPFHSNVGRLTQMLNVPMDVFFEVYASPPYTLPLPRRLMWLDTGRGASVS